MKTALLALSLLLAQAPSPMTLRRTLAPGSVDTYKIEDRVEQTVSSAMGQMPMTITSKRTYVLKTTQIDEKAGTARFEATTTVDTITADGAAAAMAAQKPGPLVQKGKLDVRGRMTLDPVAPTDALADLMSGTQGALAAGMFVEFPEKAVRIGDAWDVVVPKSPYLYDADQKLTETLIGEREVAGTPVWVVSLKGTLKTAIDGAKLPTTKSSGPLPVLVQGEDVLTGEGLVEKATGRTLSMSVKGVSKRKIELTDSGLVLDVEGKVDSTAKLEKG